MATRWEAFLDWLGGLIVRPGSGANRSRLRRRFPQIAAAISIVICLVGAWGVVQNPFGTSGVTPGQLVATAPTVPAGTTVGSDETSPRQRPSVVPAGTHLWSISTPNARTWFALASIPCGDDRCPAVLRSRDAGTSWQVVHRFDHADTSVAEVTTQPVIQPPGALSGLTFVDATTGYVFGSDLWMTSDGGASFTRVPHASTSVLDVVAHGRTVDVLTSDGCAQGTCSGRLSLARVQAGSRGPLPQPLAGVTPTSTISSGTLVAGDSPLLLTQGLPGSSGDTPGAWQATGSTLVALPVRTACHGNAMLAAAATAQRTVALCDASPALTTTSSSTLVRSGSTWSLLGTGNLSLPTQGRIALAALDGTHLVATTGGPRAAADGTTRSDTRTSIALSTDAGRTWHAPHTPPHGVSGGFDSVVAVGPRTAVAVTRTDNAFWRSTDAGMTWKRHTVTAR